MNRILISLLLFLTTNVLGQGIPAELYQYNYNLVHPAFSGSEGQRITMLANSATHDVGFGDGEVMVTGFLSYENYFDRINSGISVVAYSERFGPSSFSSFGLSYNYSVALTSTTDLVAATSIRRHFYSTSIDFFRQIGPSDPVLNPDLSQANWTADIGLLLKVKEFYVGVLSNNILHTNERIDMLGNSTLLDRNYAVIVGASFRINDRMQSEHSIYFPVKGEDYRIDLNNTLIINDLFLAGASVERSQDKIVARINAGIRLKDHVQVVFLLYSGKRDELPETGLRGEALIGFKF